MEVPWTLTVLGALSLVALLVSEERAGRVRLIAKPAASACFVATAVSLGALDTSYGSWILVGLVFSAIGDVALLGRATPLFLGGLVSFLLGHVAYVVAFGVRGLDAAWMAAALLALAPVVVVVLRWLLPHAGSLRVPVVLYAVVISAMVAFAAGTVGADGDWRILVGAVAFYLSDLAVARDRFVSERSRSARWGLPLYYGAQFLLAWTVVT